MANFRSWLIVLNFISVCAWRCENEDAASATVSLRQLVVQKNRGWSDASMVTDDKLPAICAGGKLLPEAYLLGAPKCGTTELADDMMASGLQSVAWLSTAANNPNWEKEPGWPKEFHYFVRWWRWNNRTWDLEKSRNTWFESMPPCVENKNVSVRSVSGDFTPTQLAFVPPGDGMRVVGTVNPQDLDIWNVDMARALEVYYSHYLGADSKRVRFIVNFREPLARMQSHWYHSKNEKMTMPFYAGDSFTEDVRLTIDEFEQGNVMLPLWYSLYGRQVQRYLSAFNPNQFIFIPYHYYVYLAKGQVCETLSHFLNYPVTCKDVKAKEDTLKHYHHPTVEEEVPSDLMQRFQDTIAGENRLLVEQLSLAYQEGATLANFLGFSGVEAWLKAGW